MKKLKTLLLFVLAAEDYPMTPGSVEATRALPGRHSGVKGANTIFR